MLRYGYAQEKQPLNRYRAVRAVFTLWEPAALAAELGLKRERVDKWKRREHIPQRWHRPVSIMTGIPVSVLRTGKVEEQQ